MTQNRKTKAFPVGAVLSVVTGVMVSETGVGGIYAVLNWMTGESVYTHQIPRICREAEPVILLLNPTLQKAKDEAKAVTRENYKEWLQTWKNRYGEEIPVPILTIAEHERIDPLSELAEFASPDRIINVSIEGGNG
ncbi:hypothetical protein [Agrobacterium vitis]|uniref:DUF7736 domain-containing protein n=1 Tax=Agrobacterium vitis TaxID=373 RepID=UPI0012E84CDA|nr:hypothetical protein [Agrobacterium vitis]MVA28742.1 hypothetical protein [Agrobacterium vitis]